MDLKNIEIETIQTQKDKISHVLCHMWVLYLKGQINVCLLQMHSLRPRNYIGVYNMGNKIEALRQIVKKVEKHMRQECRRRN